MNDSITLQGIWFLPNSSESVGGTFSFNRIEGGYLEIIDSLGKRDLLKKERIEIINGVVLGGKRVSLVYCKRALWKKDLDKIEIVRYYVEGAAYIGYDFKSLDEILFDKIKISLTDLETWVGVYGVKEFKVAFQPITINIEYQSPEDITFAISDELAGAFEFLSHASIGKHTEKNEITQSTFVSIRTKNLVPERVIKGHFYTLYKYFSFAFYDTPPVLSVFLYNSSIVDPSDPKSLLEVQLLYRDNFYNSSYKKEKHPHDFLFTYSEIKNEFPKIIKQWYVLYEKTGHSINLLNELLMQRGLPIEIQFLTAMQAVESFHRNIIGGEILHKAEFETKVNSILEKLSPEEAKWLKGELKYSNELKLKVRLGEIYDRIPVEITNKLIDRKKKSFIGAVVSQRNQYTHPDSSKNKKALSFEELIKSVKRLKLLLVCSLLNELGFKKEEMIKAVKNFVV